MKACSSGVPESRLVIASSSLASPRRSSSSLLMPSMTSSMQARSASVRSGSDSTTSLATAFGLGWLVQAQRALRQAALVAVLLLCAAGLTAAVFQHEVASQTASCAMGLADKIVTALDLEDLWPAVFMITANCAEAAAYRFIGLPYEVWSGLLFAAMAAPAAWGLTRR